MTGMAVDLEETIDEQADLGEVVAEHGPFRMTESGVIAAKTATYDEWAEAFGWAQRVEKSSQFWIGDLLAYGDRFGEEASQVLESTEYAEQSCKNAKHVCSTIPPERRKPGLGFSKHQEIAALPAEADQDYWLNKCEEENLTREALRAQIKVAQAGAEGHVELWLTVKCHDLADQEALAEKLRLEGRSVKMHSKKVAEAEAA